MRKILNYFEVIGASIVIILMCIVEMFRYIVVSIWRKVNNNKRYVTPVLVLIFLVFLVFGRDAEASEGEPVPYFALGKSILATDFTVSEFGFRINKKWDVHAGMFGEGETKRGYHKPSVVYSFSRIMQPNWCTGNWCIKPGIGAAYTPKVPVVGPWNFRLRGIINYKDYLEIELSHYSSAGTFDPNTGVDLIQFRLFL